MKHLIAHVPIMKPINPTCPQPSSTYHPVHYLTPSCGFVWKCGTPKSSSWPWSPHMCGMTLVNEWHCQTHTSCWPVYPNSLHFIWVLHPTWSPFSSHYILPLNILSTSPFSRLGRLWRRCSFEAKGSQGAAAGQSPIDALLTLQNMEGRFTQQRIRPGIKQDPSLCLGCVFNFDTCSFIPFCNGKLSGEVDLG